MIEQIHTVFSSTPTKLLQVSMKKTSSAALWTSSLLEQRQHPRPCAGLCSTWLSTQKFKVNMWWPHWTEQNSGSHGLDGTRREHVGVRKRAVAVRQCALGNGHVLYMFAQNWDGSQACRRLQSASIHAPLPMSVGLPIFYWILPNSILVLSPVTL